MKLEYFEFRQIMAVQGFSNHLRPSGQYHYVSRKRLPGAPKFTLEFCSDEETPGLDSRYLKNEYWVALTKGTLYLGAWHRLDICSLKQKLGDCIAILDKALSACEAYESMQVNEITTAFNQFIASIQKND